MRAGRTALAMAAVVAGCSSLEGLSGDHGDAGREAPSDAALPVDATADHAIEGDAYSASDGGARNGCRSITADFCMDFDDQMFPGVWSVDTTGAGTVMLDGTSSYSPSFSMVSATNGVTGDNGGGIARPTGPLPDIVVMQARLRVDEGAASSNYDAFSVSFDKQTGADYSFDLEISSTLDLYAQQIEFQADGGLSSSTREAVGIALRTGEWALVKLTYTVATEKADVFVRYEDGTERARSVAIRGAAYRTAGRVLFGDDRVQNGAEWRVHFDDVALDVTP